MRILLSRASPSTWKTVERAHAERDAATEGVGVGTVDERETDAAMQARLGLER